MWLRRIVRNSLGWGPDPAVCTYAGSRRPCDAPIGPTPIFASVKTPSLPDSARMSKRTGSAGWDFTAFHTSGSIAQGEW